MRDALSLTIFLKMELKTQNHRVLQFRDSVCHIFLGCCCFSAVCLIFHFQMLFGGHRAWIFFSGGIWLSGLGVCGAWVIAGCECVGLCLGEDRISHK